MTATLPITHDPLPFGKHRGRTLASLVAGRPDERGYVEWMAREFSNDVWRKRAQDALQAAAQAQEVPRGFDYVIDVVSDTTASLVCPYDQRIVSLLRERVDGINWQRSAQRWEFPVTQLVAVHGVLSDVGQVVLSPAAAAAADRERERRSQLDIIRRNHDTALEIPTLLPLFPFQRVGVEFVLAAGGRALIADEMGCVDGDTVLALNRAGRGFSMTIRDLYGRFHGHTGAWDLHIPTYCRALANDRFAQHRVVDVLDKGVRPVVRVTTRSGKVLRLTPDHELRLFDGTWRPAGSLHVGDVLTRNGTLVCAHCQQPGQISTYRYAKFYGLCRRCVYRTFRAKPTFKGGRFVDANGYVRVSGQQDHPRANRSGQVYEHILVMEQQLGRLISRDEIVHHRNGNKSDNRIENLELTTHAEHMRIHDVRTHLHGGRSARGGRVVVLPEPDTIVSIAPDGDAQVYDLVMADPHRNFVANGLVVHNCGKTSQAIGSALLLQQTQTIRRILVVCPASLKINWYREWVRFAGIEPTIWHGQKRVGDLDAPVHVINYDIVLKFRAELEALGFDLLIIDEAHYLKNKDSLRTQALFGGFNRKTRTRLKPFPAPYAVLLTGTPVLNRPAELYPLLHFLAPDRFTDWFAYANRYGAWQPGNMDGRPWKPKNLDELHDRTKDIVIRRKKVDVLTELPPKLVSDVFVELTKEQRQHYQRTLGDVADAWADAAKEHRKPTLAELQVLTALLNQIKLHKVRELVDELQNEDDVRPVLVFCTRLDPLKQLRAEYGDRAIYIDGSMTPEDRQNEVDRFQRGTATIALLSLRAAGVGLTLTKADTVIFIDQDFVPANHLQAEDRAHRIGQVNPVQVYYLLAEDTIDQDLRALLADKVAITSQIADGELRQLERQRSVFTDFVRRLKSRHKQFAKVAEP